MAIVTAISAILAGAASVAGAWAAGATITLATFLVPAGIAAVGGFILSRLAPRVDPQGFDQVGAAARTIRGAVVPQRWVVGRARVAGVLVWLHDQGGSRNLDLVYVLGAGPMDAIEEIWVNGQPGGAVFTGDFDNGATGLLTEGRYANRSGQPLFRAYLSGDPDNIVGTPPIVERFSMMPPRPWTAAHQLRGLAWVHVELHQPPYESDLSRRVWNQIPELHFLVRGLKFTHPRNATVPAWTQNAAAIRYWWLTERRGIPADQIEASHYNAAFDACGEFVRLDGLDGFTDEYPPNFHRYSINGVIVAGDRPEVVEANMDAAWAGNVVEFDGIHRFLPGIDRPVTGIITGDDIVESPTFRPAPEHHERVNQITARISQSRYHQHTEYGLPAVDDGPAQARDGSVLPADLGTLAYVNDPVQGFSIIAKQLRRERAVAQIDMIVRPGDAFENVTLAPGEVVSVTLPEWGLSGRRYLVLASEVEDDWRVRLSLIEHPDGIYAETLRLPPIGGRSFVPTDPPDNSPALGQVVVSAAYSEPGPASREITGQPPADPVCITWSWPVVGEADGYEYQLRPSGEQPASGSWIGTTGIAVKRAAFTIGGDFMPDQVGSWRFFVRARARNFAIPDPSTSDFAVLGAVSPPRREVATQTDYQGEVSGEDQWLHTIRVHLVRASDNGGTHAEYREGGAPDYPGSYGFTRAAFPASGRLQIYARSAVGRGAGGSVSPLTAPGHTWRAVDASATPEVFSPMQ